MTMDRRSFLRAAGALPFAARRSATAQARPQAEPYFPSAAHQFVWRNWDLAPAKHIAAALGCAPAIVQTLARSMGIDEQPDTAAYRSRLRFKALRRNWDFVPLDQLTALLEISERDIQELLGQDSFYVGHLGAKPDCPAIRVAGQPSPALLPRFRIQTAGGPRELRFRFIEDLKRADTGAPWASDGSFALTPRIAFPYFALYGDVLKEPDFESYYPSGVLANMARIGLSAVWLHAVLRDLVRTEVFPEFGADRGARLRRLNWLIAEAKKHGLGVYLYLNEPRAMPEPFFARHPELKGAPGRPGDGLHCVCTSTEPVRRYLREATAALFREAPGLEGVLLITASENPTNCYSLARNTACPRCRKRPGPEVIGEVVRLIEQGARSVKPEAHIIAWDWSWGIIEDDPQERIIAQLPSTATLMVDFERGQPITRRGIRSTVDEYSLSVSGPSPRAAAHIRQARGRGMRVMAKVQTGTTWELGLLPYVPVPHLVARKFEALRASGISGAMESWTLGTYPSVNWQVAQAFYGASPPTVDAAVGKVASELYGPRNAAEAAGAWRIFADVFTRYPFSNALVYSSVVQYGPAHPIWFEPSGKQPRILNSYDILGWTKPFGPEAVADQFGEMAAEWQRGVATLKQVASHAPPEKRRGAARDAAIAEAVYLYFRSISNQVRFHWFRGQGTAPGLLRKILEDELSIAARFLEICEADSRVGFEASLQYFYLPLDIREKIVACRYMLEERIKG